MRAASRLGPAARTGASPAILALTAAAVALVAGAALATGGTASVAMVWAVAGLAVVAPLLVSSEAKKSGFLVIELPIALLLLSTLVFRQRDAAQLAQDPFDAAAILRIACVGAALALTAPVMFRDSAIGALRVPAGVRLYALYALVVFVGALFSVKPELTIYRGFEIVAGIVVVVTALRIGGADALRRLERLLYVFVVALVVSVWVGVLVFPGEAVIRDVKPIPFQIQGIYPAVASNGVGELGAILLLWSLGRMIHARATGRPHAADRWMAALGAVTLVAGQYRTGYLAVAAALALLFAVRWRGALALLAVAGVVVAGAWGFSNFTREAQPVLLRGQTPERAAELSGRVEIWHHAIPVWLESPLFGKGLGTATRFEVLEPLGLGSISTVHSTWVEALVGTGIVGTSLLVAFLFVLWRRALPAIGRESHLVAPALLLMLITVRTSTGPTFELFGFTALLMLVLAYRLAPRRSLGAVDGTVGPASTSR